MARSDKLKGALDLLILRSLRSAPMHGYGIVRSIQSISQGALEVEEGSLYPALHRIEQEGWIDSEWKQAAGKRRAKYYRLTAAGRKRLDSEIESWNRLTAAVRLVLKET
jgi:transcriptional regulator